MKPEHVCFEKNGKSQNGLKEMVMPLEHVIHCVCNISSYCQFFAVIYAANLLSTREFINLPLSGVWVKLIYTTQQHKSQDLRGFYNLHSVQHPWFEWENTFPPKHSKTSRRTSDGSNYTVSSGSAWCATLHTVNDNLKYFTTAIPSKGKGKDIGAWKSH